METGERSALESVFEPRESFLDVSDLAIALVLLPLPEGEPRDHPQRAHAGQGSDRALRQARGGRQPPFELTELAVEPSSRSLDLLHRLSCCFAHRTSSFSVVVVRSGLVAPELSQLRARAIAMPASSANTAATISIAAHRGMASASPSAPANPRKPMTNKPRTAATPMTAIAFARAPTI